MNVFVLLALLSVIGAAALFVALALNLVRIVDQLEAIGGSRPAYGMPASYLSKIRLGVRAIETQTGGLAPQVTLLNGGLGAVRDGLGAIDANLGSLIDSLSGQAPKQEER